MQAPVILDIEASGFGVGSYPIEIGYADADGKTWCALIRPQSEWQHWDGQAERLHGITRERLHASGRDVADIVSHLNDTFAGQVVYTDAWLHDFVWLNTLFEAADSVPLFRLEDLRFRLSPAQQAIWHDTKQALIKSSAVVRHRASADAKLLQQTWQKTQALTMAVTR